MRTTHTVKQGECLSQIAARYGFADWKVVYDHASNAELRRLRPNPNVLRPGDQVHIPDLDEKTVDAATGRSHPFVVKRPRKVLRLRMVMPDGTAYAGSTYRLEIGDEKREGTTDGDGLLRERVPFDATYATVHLEEHVIELHLGHLDPLTDPEDADALGIQARLHNLGYDVGVLDGTIGNRTRAAIATFQADHDLEVDGIAGPKTRNKLESIHGC